MQAQSVGLMLVLDGQPQRVEWRSVHPRLKHSPVWVSCSIASMSDIVDHHRIFFSLIFLLLEIEAALFLICFVALPKDVRFNQLLQAAALAWK